MVVVNGGHRPPACTTSAAGWSALQGSPAPGPGTHPPDPGSTQNLPTSSYAQVSQVTSPDHQPYRRSAGVAVAPARREIRRHRRCRRRWSPGGHLPSETRTPTENSSARNREIAEMVVSVVGAELAGLPSICKWFHHPSAGRYSIVSNEGHSVQVAPSRPGPGMCSDPEMPRIQTQNQSLERVWSRNVPGNGRTEIQPHEAPMSSIQSPGRSKNCGTAGNLHGERGGSSAQVFRQLAGTPL